MTDPLVRLAALSVRYDNVPALDGIDLALDPGKRLAVIGESGSGKTTLGLALAGLLPDNASSSGRIDWPLLRHAPVPGRDFGFVFQDPAASLNPVLTVGEQIAEVTRRHSGLSWHSSYMRAGELVERVGLPQPQAILDAYPHQLSGGQRQRVCIASSIAAGPGLLIADEPTSALDTIVQAEILSLLDELTRQQGMAVILITHDIALASGFVDRIAVLHQGRLVETGPTAKVLSHPMHAYTRQLMAAHIDLSNPPLVEAKTE